MSIEFDCSFKYPQGFELKLQWSSSDSVTALCGPSGCGKTSVLKLISGHLKPQQGLIRIGDQCVFDSTNRLCLPPHKRFVGLVSQESLLFPHMTVEANLRYGMNQKKEPEDSFDHVVQVLELNDYLKRYPKSLSGGQARRVAIGRALLSEPKLLLFDEPWAGLDTELKHKAIDLVKQCIKEWNIPSIIVSHDQSDIEAMSEKVIYLKDGKVVQK